MQVSLSKTFARQLQRPGRRCPRVVRAVTNKLVLQPTGDGSCKHLDAPIPMPGPIELKAGVFEIGRAEPADIIIPVPTVSSRHALLRVEDGKVSITDLNSTNGTMVNGQELAPMKALEVVVGGEIVFGDMYLAKFKLAEDVATPTTAADTAAPAS